MRLIEQKITANNDISVNILLFLGKDRLPFLPPHLTSSAHYVSTFGTCARVAELVDALD